MMNVILDIEILKICKKKNKIAKIKKMLNTIGNFEQDDVEKWFKVYSLSIPDKFYKVFISRTGYKCDCIFNYKYKEYREGMKKYKNSNNCIHILALQCHLNIMMSTR